MMMMLFLISGSSGGGSHGSVDGIIYKKYISGEC